MWGDFMAKIMMAGMILREMENGKNIWREGGYGNNHDEMFVNFGQRCPNVMHNQEGHLRWVK